MNIDEAIETLGYNLRNLNPNVTPKLFDATKLGLEALRREKSNRDNPDYVMVGKLPGETEE